MKEKNEEKHMDDTSQDNPKRFRSCFIRDVAVGRTAAVLEDTGGATWNVDFSKPELARQFTAWFKSFLSRTSQELTVLQYAATRVNECEI